MNDAVTRIVIVGGGTAGWLSACYLAARKNDLPDPLTITLIEAPNIPSIGVGEGTWPTMRETLRTIGIDEAAFLRACDASFKQGSRFDGWVTGDADDRYLHPFTPPPAVPMPALLDAWNSLPDEVTFAGAVCAQADVCAKDLAPRQLAMPGYGGALNYAYHLDAAKLANALATHATSVLGVSHVRDTVIEVLTDHGSITALRTEQGGNLEADLFIDCTGLAGRLIGDALGSEWIDWSDDLLNDRALAVQLPTDPGAPVASQTVATAHSAGWIWDIALPTRRGIGCVYASRFCDDATARQTLADYVATIAPDVDLSDLSPRLITFPTGHRERFWKGNCVAVGLSAGFIEPLEASAIVLIELSLRAIADNFPRRRSAMTVHAARFNTLFAERWERIRDFLKLHYALSTRDEPYWQAQRDPGTFSPELAGNLERWLDQPPSTYDFPHIDELFPPASQQYVYYGMRGRPDHGRAPSPPAIAALSAVRERARQLSAALPTNRDYLDRLRGEDNHAATTRKAARS